MTVSEIEYSSLSKPFFKTKHLNQFLQDPDYSKSSFRHCIKLSGKILTSFTDMCTAEVLK